MNSVKNFLLRQQQEAETLRRDDLYEGVEYTVEKLEETATRYGEAILATISYDGVQRKLYMPKYFRLTADAIKNFNANAWEEKLIVYKKNNLIKIK
jgi:DNA replication initiation complex subunit (GINS family)